jgi:hypothetical protein
MTITRVQSNAPYFTGLSTDIVANTFTGALSFIGTTLYTSDDSKWYIIKSDGTLGDYSLPVSVSVTSSGLTDTELRATPVPVSGSVKGTGFSIPVTLTVTNGAYSIADVVGGLITFAGASSAAGKRSVIHTITLAGVAALAYELWFFASDITTTALDNAAFTLVAADVAQCKGVIPIATTDYYAPQSSFNVATLRGVAFEYSCTATTLYAYLKATATTTPGTTTLTLTIKGEFID